MHRCLLSQYVKTMRDTAINVGLALISGLRRARASRPPCSCEKQQPQEKVIVPLLHARRAADSRPLRQYFPQQAGPVVYTFRDLARYTKNSSSERSEWCSAQGRESMSRGEVATGHTRVAQSRLLVTRVTEQLAVHCEWPRVRDRGCSNSTDGAHFQVSPYSRATRAQLWWNEVATLSR